MWIVIALVRAGRFFVGGVPGTATYYLIFFVLLKCFHVGYVTSTIAGSVVATAVSFALHKFWTFRNSEAHEVRRQMGLFAAKSIMLFIVSTAGLTVLVGLLHLQETWAQGILALPLLALNFLSTAWIFKIRAAVRA